jgi:myo-inositol-1(or 4)-monophosphatase
MSTGDAPRLSEFAAFASEVARAAGAMVLRAFEARDHAQVEFKTGPDNLVTRTDREAEALIAASIGQRYPRHGLLGEEGHRQTGEEVQWIIDPIDGTINFVHGVPWFAVSLALARAERLEVGVVYRPACEELFVAERGAGAFLIGPSGAARRLAPSATGRLEESLIGVGLPAHPERSRASPLLTRFSELSREIRVMGSAALHLADVAAGRLDAFVEPHLSAWDIAAGVLLVHEAGGRVTDFAGQPLSGVTGADVVASNGRLHDAVLGVISGRHHPSRDL